MSLVVAVLILNLVHFCSPHANGKCGTAPGRKSLNPLHDKPYVLPVLQLHPCRTPFSRNPRRALTTSNEMRRTGPWPRGRLPERRKRNASRGRLRRSLLWGVGRQEGELPCRKTSTKACGQPGWIHLHCNQDKGLPLSFLLFSLQHLAVRENLFKRCNHVLFHFCPGLLPGRGK
jgi:hypothetical protein